MSYATTGTFAKDANEHTVYEIVESSIAISVCRSLLITPRGPGVELVLHT